MTRRPALGLIRAALWPAVALLVVSYFAGAALVGRNGLMSLAGYRAQKSAHEGELAALQERHRQLAHRAALLDPRHVDPDLADELTRRETGQIGPAEVILPTN